MLFFIGLATHWLELLGLAYLIGAFVCRLWIIPEDALKIEHDLFAKIWKICTFASLLMLGGNFVNVCCLVSDIDANVSLIIFKTHFGSVCLIRFFLIICFFLYWIGGGRFRENKIFLITALAIMVAIGFTESMMGHPAGWGDFALPVWVNCFHILAACVWGGGLLVLSTGILPEIHGKEHFKAQLLVAVAFAFSRMALLAVAVVAVTAVYNAWTYIGSVAALVSTPYGWTALVKAVLFLILVGIGVVNRYVLLPFLKCHCDHNVPVVRVTQSAYRRAVRLKSIVNLECLLIIIVFFASALLHHQMPASHFIPEGITRHLPYE